MLRQRTSDSQIRRARGRNVRVSTSNSAATEASTVHTSPYERADDRRDTARCVSKPVKPVKYVPLPLSTTSAAASGEQDNRPQDPSTTFIRNCRKFAQKPLGTDAEHVSAVEPVIAMKSPNETSPVVGVQLDRDPRGIHPEPAPTAIHSLSSRERPTGIEVQERAVSQVERA